jgi:dethiobiotin synthetase
VRGIFVTGTDTNCGKTEVSLGLMAAWQSRGLRTLGMKPVATGCKPGPTGLQNADALRLQAQGSSRAPYGLVNPYAFEPPIAPHIAAGQSGAEIELGPIANAYRTLAAESDRMVVEGVGGWRVPLSTSRSVSDLPRALGLPVLMVVGLRLGCLNHALLTAESIRADGAHLAGWVANGIDPRMEASDANLATLAALLGSPCIGVVPWLSPPEPSELAGYLNPELLAWPPATEASLRPRGSAETHRRVELEQQDEPARAP